MIPEYIASYDQDGKFCVIHHGLVIKKDPYNPEWRKFLIWNKIQPPSTKLDTADIDPKKLEDPGNISLLGLYRMILENRIALNRALESLGISLRLGVPTLDEFNSDEAIDKEPTRKV